MTHLIRKVSNCDGDRPQSASSVYKNSPALKTCGTRVLPHQLMQRKASRERD